MNWNKERTKKNDCGYCIDFTCVCDGRCFIESETNKKEIVEKNRFDHLETELQLTKERLKELNKEFKLLINNK